MYYVQRTNEGPSYHGTWWVMEVRSNGKKRLVISYPHPTDAANEAERLNEEEVMNMHMPLLIMSPLQNDIRAFLSETFCQSKLTYDEAAYKIVQLVLGMK